VAILLKIYAKCLDGQDAVAKRRIEDALGDAGDAGDEGTTRIVQADDNTPGQKHNRAVQLFLLGKFPVSLSIHKQQCKAEIAR
jgi:hypothetical protein